MDGPENREDDPGAELVLPCRDLERTLGAFVDELGFRLEMIFPADGPRVARVARDGLRLRLEQREGDGLALAELSLPASGRGPEHTPDGLAITRRAPVAAPPCEPTLVVTRAGGGFATGRAGMGYRDLLPGRWGGRYIASHIRIADRGEVPDYVHHHAVRFQMIHCLAGRVRVVYEGQGEPFWLEAGDGVLQPPHIRHRVLECSAGLEVIELGLPAEHPTFVDHELTLPTAERREVFGGQRFAHYRAAGATWRPWDLPGLEARDTGLREATGGLAEVNVVRAPSPTAPARWSPAGELLFLCVTRGELAFEHDGRHETLGRADAVAFPPGSTPELTARTEGTEFLEVRVIT